jgi:cytochrome c
MRSRAKAAVFLALVIALAGSAGAGAYYYQQKEQSRREAIALTHGDPDRAAELMIQYGCAGCHTITGIRSPGGLAAQSLSDIGKRQYIGGVAPNTPQNLVRWIVNPKHFSARTAMPVTGVNESQARHIAAYLLALR